MRMMDDEDDGWWGWWMMRRAEDWFGVWLLAVISPMTDQPICIIRGFHTLGWDLLLFVDASASIPSFISLWTSTHTLWWRLGNLVDFLLHWSHYLLSFNVRMVTVESMHSKEGVKFFLKIVNKWIIWITVHQHCILEQTMIHMIRNTNSFTNYKYITKWWQKQIQFRACPTFTAVYWLEHNFLPLNQAAWAFLAMITLIQQALWQCFKYFFFGC